MPASINHGRIFFWNFPSLQDTKQSRFLSATNYVWMPYGVEDGWCLEKVFDPLVKWLHSIQETQTIRAVVVRCMTASNMRRIEYSSRLRYLLRKPPHVGNRLFPYPIVLSLQYVTHLTSSCSRHHSSFYSLLPTPHTQRICLLLFWMTKIGS